MSGVDLLIIDELTESDLRELFYDAEYSGIFLLIGIGLTILLFIV